MELKVIQRILGLLLIIFSFSMFPPAIVGSIYQDSDIWPFLDAFLLLAGVGFVFWWFSRNDKKELRAREGFIIVVLFWLVLGFCGALPLALSKSPNISIIDSIFESFSGLTTTGATVLTQIDNLPHSILFYRHQLQWLGGMGIIVLAVAILPMLGIGGMQLYRAETPGPIKDSKLTPRITETAKSLWYIYLGLTVACGLLLWLAGMSIFDAIAHSFSTVAIGGFSTHDASIGYFNSPLIEAIIIIFMILAGINFSLHFSLLRNFSLKNFFADTELRGYLFFLFFGFILVTFALIFTGYSEPVRHAIFQTVSIATTTGFATTDFSAWPLFIPVLLVFLSFVGGCAGSAGGGMKVIRFVLLWKQGAREIHRLIHPSAEFPVKLSHKIVPENVISAVWGFFALYVATFAIIMLLLMTTGLDQVTAFTAVAACLNNLGPGLGDVSANYGSINNPAKLILSFAMLIGRLEIFSILVLFSPSFWRQW